MTDRASVNKLFNQKLSEYRNRVLEKSNVNDIHYLYCNAHFLLGLSNMTDQVLKSEIKLFEGRLGVNIRRDAFDKFRRFKNAGESGPARFVRTSCDCLGPRGDEKSGCKID